MKQAIEKINLAKRILITTHVNPDGDGIGAGLAFMLALNKVNEDHLKNVRFIIDDKVPTNFEMLEGSFIIENVEFVDTKYDFDLVISVDAAEKKRIGRVKKFVSKDSFLINIDHHISNTNYGDLNIINTETSSASEIIYSLIKEMEIELDKNIAEAIYCGIINDTGNFSYNNVKPETFRIAAELLELGIDNEKITYELLFKKSEERIKLLGLALNDMELDPENELVFYYLPYEKLEKYGKGEKENTEGIVEALRSYEKCDVALFLRGQKDGKIKGSFRSKYTDVNRIAKIFGGGGHKKAAGFTTEKSVEEIIKTVKNEIRKD